ncbi:Ig-like domain-containing protein [Methanosarcina sp. 2.H.A.1B.4]|uniref:Ig-like domain-containing protein n=1 Tax=Methanosarcina sp. 2.H.A.1B.4 TaxID=1483600 RepID=UPI000621F84C|nr:hypothetical protein [Methanosarcina sp. 2.H.A.1B.4]KKG07404.1 hypothetical protein EO92_15145 [Methanosarcina sp. 2.H.A.1B.4]
MLKFAFDKWMKVLCIFTLVFFVLSMTGAACSSSSSTSKYKTDAISDTYKVPASQTSKTFNVLANDKGSGLKVVTTGYITTAKGGKVLMKSNGAFSYVKPVACSKKSDSFTYKAVNRYGAYDTAKVTLNFKCSTSCSSCTRTSTCSKTSTCTKCSCK